ncbi:hypothetical protein QFZ58_004104 [Streptomyces sp. B1I3]|nr:hypothetical protein [Streptomyces sp. B1I3]
MRTRAFGCPGGDAAPAAGWAGSLSSGYTGARTLGAMGARADARRYGAGGACAGDGRGRNTATSCSPVRAASGRRGRGAATLGEGVAAGGPALDLTSGAYGPKRARAVTSAISPSTEHRTTSAPCAAATSLAAPHAVAAPRSARSAAASAARSAAPPALWRAATAWPSASTVAKTAHNVAVVTATHTVASPRSTPSGPRVVGPRPAPSGPPPHPLTVLLPRCPRPGPQPRRSASGRDPAGPA